MSRKHTVWSHVYVRHKYCSIAITLLKISNCDKTNIVKRMLMQR